jgi:hypothetical protein
VESPFRLTEPTPEHLEAFHRDGYVALPNIFTKDARNGLVDEVTNLPDVQSYLLRDEDDQADEDIRPYFVRPWNARGAWGHSLIDAPLVTALLQATIEKDYHFCHSALNLSPRGARPVRLHMDHHHWFHRNPINLVERNNWYIQILYYPNGFTRGDRSLSVVPGSHRVAPTQEVTPDRLLSGEFDQEAGCELKLKRLELPPGSMIYLNARMFHAVDPKPLESPQEHRIFIIDIFKQAGPPHRHTQAIPAVWWEQASDSRRRLFDREPYSPGCWLETKDVS